MKTSGFHCLNRRDPNKEGLNNALTKKIRYHKVIPLYITANERYWLVFSHGTVHFEEIEKGSHQRLFSNVLLRIFESGEVKAYTGMLSLRVA